MNETTYKAMKNAGAVSITLGIVAVVIGIIVGVLSIVNGGKLLKKKSNIMF